MRRLSIKQNALLDQLREQGKRIEKLSEMNTISSRKGWIYQVRHGENTEYHRDQFYLTVRVMTDTHTTQTRDPSGAYLECQTSPPRRILMLNDERNVIYGGEKMA
jgi:hypothetical protein